MHRLHPQKDLVLFPLRIQKHVASMSQTSHPSLLDDEERKSASRIFATASRAMFLKWILEKESPSGELEHNDWERAKDTRVSEPVEKATRWLDVDSCINCRGRTACVYCIRALSYPSKPPLEWLERIVWRGKCIKILICETQFSISKRIQATSHTSWAACVERSPDLFGYDRAVKFCVHRNIYQRLRFERLHEVERGALEEGDPSILESLMVRRGCSKYSNGIGDGAIVF
jgi:hypothetical protein